MPSIFPLHLPRGPALLAFGVLLGLACPPLAEAARPLMPGAILLIVLGTLLRVELGAMSTMARRPSHAIMLPALIMLGCPALAALGAGALGLAPDLAMAVVLACAAPPSSGTAAVARMLGLDDAPPIVVTLLSIVLAPLTVPLVASTFGGLAISPLDLAMRLAIVVGGAVALAVLIRRCAADLLRSQGAAIDGAIVLALLVFALATMAGIRSQIAAEPAVAGLCLALAFATNLGMQALGAAVLAGSLKQRLTIGLILGNRNVGLIWSTIGTAASPRMALFFAATQLPIYLTPLLIDALVGRAQRPRQPERAHADRDS